MMTVFQNSPFARFELGRHAHEATPLALPRARLGQAPSRAAEYGFNILADILGKVGVTEDDINKALDKIPASSIGPYRTRLDQCKAMGVESPQGIACLYTLYNEIKAAGEKKPVVAPPPAPAPSSFPVVPVAIAGVAAVALIYFLVKGKK